MARQQVPVIMTFATSGDGKSFDRCARFIADVFLPECDGVHYSNFPIEVDAMASFVAAKTGEPAEKYRERIVLIPRDVLLSWEEEKSGPWETFKGMKLEGAHIAIDEAHRYIPKEATRAHKKKWKVWLGEIRHAGATVELISQHFDKLAVEARNEAGVEYRLEKADQRRDPFCKILMGDWLELLAAFTRKYTSFYWKTERRRALIGWRVERVTKHLFPPEYFKLYRSHSRDEEEGEEAKEPPHEYLKRSRFGVIKWFLRKNWFPLSWRVAVCCIVIWLCTGGAVSMFQKGLAYMQIQMSRRVAAKAGKAVEVKNGVEVVRGTPTPADPVETAVTLRKQLNETQASLKLMGDEKARMETALNKVIGSLSRSYTLVAITQGTAVFQNGERYHENQEIKMGPLVGRTITRIDWGERLVRLDDGRELRMGVEPNFTANDYGIPPDLIGQKPADAIVPGTKSAASAAIARPMSVPPVVGPAPTVAERHPVPGPAPAAGALPRFVPTPDTTGGRFGPSPSDVSGSLSSVEREAIRRFEEERRRNPNYLRQHSDGIGFVPTMALPGDGSNGDSSGEFGSSVDFNRREPSSGIRGFGPRSASDERSNNANRK